MNSAITRRVSEWPATNHVHGVEDRTGTLTGMLVDVGLRLGLFEALACQGPATLPQLASRTGLNEAYVREWLRAMVEAGRLDHDEGTRLFSVPVPAAAIV